MSRDMCGVRLCLLAVSGEGRLADRAERAFFNAGPATVSRDFKTHVYFQSPNRFADGSPDFPHGPRAGGGSYQPKHSPLCCTAALNRIVPYYVTQMWMATYDNGLAATCYGPCKVTALAADRVPVEITCNTDYPFNETIEMSVQAREGGRIPTLLPHSRLVREPRTECERCRQQGRAECQGLRVCQPELEAGRHRPFALPDDGTCADRA